MRASRFLTTSNVVFWSLTVLSPAAASGLVSAARPDPSVARSRSMMTEPLQESHASIAGRLLDRLQETFDKIGGPTTEADLGHELSVLSNDGRDFLAGGILTPAFHARFARLLLVVRLATITDTGRVLASVTDREFASFVRDVTGKTYDPRGSVSLQIAMFSDAVATELTRLRAAARQLK